MKRTITLMLLAIVASVSAAYVYAGTPVSLAQLPQAARTFLTKYFPGDNVKKAEKDQGHRGMEYEVDLASGAEIDFRENGEWKEVKVARGKAVPSGIVPAAIAKHVSANYSGQKIVEISHKRGGYEVELSNGTELKLTEDAKPLTGQRGGNRPRR
ncbi:MAG: PepSY-like domain-containing protein [Paramuribaculum sp.]|nr:PepSY-like domain-containing protein [Paramuribaculum sp.]